MTFVITQSCCNDTSCVDVCPVDCIHPAPDEAGFATAEMLYIDPVECIDCGSCVAACPVSAVYADHEVPDHLMAYTAMNADYFTWIGEVPMPPPAAPPGAPIPGRDEPLRVAVVGGGPSGLFVADELVNSRRTQVEVTVLDRAVTPHGLVRYGVAPDHLHTKDAADMFTSIAGHRRVSLRLNVDVGRDISHDELLAHHDAVVYATGASEGRSLGIPGEDLPGSFASAEFVNWYNGRPEHVDLAPLLDHERAVVIGNGNVALDIARLLLADPGTLHATSDMAPHAIDALAQSAIREVVVVGRRGPEHAAFTSPELLALLDHPDFDVVVDPESLATLPGDEAAERTAATFAAHQKATLLRRAAESQPGTGKRLVLRFGLTPRAVLGDDRVSGVSLTPSGDDAAEAETLEAGLVLRATGYRASAVDGVPFDDPAGRFPHEEGRVLDPDSGAAVPGVYTTGWAKRGPSGVIGTNRACAAETAAALLDDLAEGRLPSATGDSAAFDALLADRGVTAVDLAGWKRLDAHERAEGKASGRPRVKVSDRETQLRIAVTEEAS